MGNLLRVVDIFVIGLPGRPAFVPRRLPGRRGGSGEGTPQRVSLTGPAGRGCPAGRAAAQAAAGAHRAQTLTAWISSGGITRGQVHTPRPRRVSQARGTATRRLT